MITFKVKDIRNTKEFPNLSYRFANLIESSDGIVMERDPIGENPLHYYIDSKSDELIVASNIKDVKAHLEQQNRPFAWERVRSVSNNTRAVINNDTFSSATAKETEIGPTLQQYGLDCTIPDYADFPLVGKRVRRLLEESIEHRLQTIPDEKIGLLLSGGLDSMSIAYFLSRSNPQRFTAFTLKVSDKEKDIVKSRVMAQRCGLDLVEVGITSIGNELELTARHYDKNRELQGTNNLGIFNLEQVVKDTLLTAGNPKKDNALCSIAMHLAAKAVNAYGLQTVFCGEGPNEFFNDYGFDPISLGFDTSDKGDISFREALTFGVKKNDRQLGRGGLAKHALVRMGKMFADAGIRLESPYFDMKIAKILTRVPHIPSYDKVKQSFMHELIADQRFNDLIEGTSKEKFQDGSGVSRVFKDYTQKRLVDMFEGIFGIRKTSYL